MAALQDRGPFTGSFILRLMELLMAEAGRVATESNIQDACIALAATDS